MGDVKNDDPPLEWSGIEAGTVKFKDHDRSKRFAGQWAFTRLVEPATIDAFNEAAYLAINPDVQDAVKSGQFTDGLEHFCKIGHSQSRKMFFNDIDIIVESKRAKLERFKDVFLPNLLVNKRTLAFDTVGEQFSEEVPISAWGYDEDFIDVIEQHRGGVIVDLGAGLRPEYFDDIINLELGNFITTDVRSFAEKLPFKDGSVDCIFSLAVFEHVLRPWDVAKEIQRVMKPGGTIYIDTAFMSPRHGYPFHYYNMTVEGLANLFDHCELQRVGASKFGHAAYSVYWTTRTLRDGLPKERQAEFESMTIGELLSYSDPYFLLEEKPFLRELDARANDDIAFTVTLVGRKKA